MFRSSARVAVAVVAAALALAAPGLPAQAALTRSDAGSAPNAEQTPVKVMPLGASITFGVGSSTGNGYRENLRQKLQQVLKLSKEKWDDARDHAMKAVVADNRMRIWYVDKTTMEVGLLFTCRLGNVDLDRPVGERRARRPGGACRPATACQRSHEH